MNRVRKKTTNAEECDGGGPKRQQEPRHHHTCLFPLSLHLLHLSFFFFIFIFIFFALRLLYSASALHQTVPVMTGGKEMFNKVKEKVGLGSSSDSEAGKGKSKMSKRITHGYYLVKGKASHPMEDYVVAEFKEVDDNELGLFAIFDGHLSQDVPDYLKSHLFENILKEPGFWTEPERAIRRAYRITDTTILEKEADLGRGGSTAVTAILINCQMLVVANVGDSRAVLCKNGVAKQLSIDHEPGNERSTIEGKGGFVTKFPGDVPRVDGQLAVARAFGDKNLKEHLSSEPDVTMEIVDDNTDFVILASDGVWKVMSNQEAVDCIKNTKDPKSAAKLLAEEAVARNSYDDISCVVVKLR